MFGALHLYGRYVGIAMRAQLQYRGAFLLACAGQFVIIATELVGVWALFARFGDLPGWSFPQVAFFYGFANSAWAITDLVTTGFDRFPNTHIRTGDFDRVLVRPRSAWLQIAGLDFALRRLGRLLMGGLALFWADARLGLAWDAERVVMFGWALSGAVVFFAAIVLLQSALAFWTVESLEAVNTFSYGGVDTGRYPFDIYPRWFRSFFLWVVPVGCVLYLPVVRVLGVDDPLGSTRALQALAPLAGYAFFALALGAWRLGVRHYTSTGS